MGGRVPLPRGLLHLDLGRGTRSPPLVLPDVDAVYPKVCEDLLPRITPKVYVVEEGGMGCFCEPLPVGPLYKTNCVGRNSRHPGSPIRPCRSSSGLTFLDST